MKKIITYVMAICLALSCVMFSACSGFFAEEELIIEDIKAETMDDGQTKITITYVDNVEPPLIFYIPKGEAGEQGEPGPSIKVSYETAKNGNTLVTISYVDSDEEPVTFEVQNGLKIDHLEQYVDEVTGADYVIFAYNDNTFSEPIYLPKAKDGNGIKTFDPQPTEDGGYVITIVLDDGSSYECLIPAPEKGDQGVGIDVGEGKTGIVGGLNADGTKYVVTFYYTNGSSESVEFARPNQWHWTSGKPSNALGVAGDYCFDSLNNDIYVKVGSYWRNIFDFDSVEETHTIIFEINAYMESGERDETAQLGFDTIVTNLKHGSFFTDNGYSIIPIPTRDGYEFVGWYTERSITPVSGKFTMLTPIVSDLTLYAIWEKI